jgi:CRP-like cAMP-binding protein
MLDRAAFVECIERSPKAALCVMASLAERLRQAADRYEERQSLDTLGRVSGVLLSLLEQGASDAPDGGKVLAARLSQQALAERAGTTRETANRALSSLKAVRAIRLEGRKIVVLDSARLRRYSEV